MRVSACRRKAQPVRLAHDARGQEGRDLAQRMACHGDGQLVQDGSDRLPRHERREQHGELAGRSGPKFFGACVEQERTERAVEQCFGPSDQCPRGLFDPGLTGTGLLAALAGKHHSDAHQCPTIAAKGFGQVIRSTGVRFVSMTL